MFIGGKNKITDFTISEERYKFLSKIPMKISSAKRVWENGTKLENFVNFTIFTRIIAKNLILDTP